MVGRIFLFYRRQTQTDADKHRELFFSLRARLLASGVLSSVVPPSGICRRQI